MRSRRAKRFTPAQWQWLAERCAFDAQRTWLSVRRGWFPINSGDDGTALVIIDNQRYGRTLRNLELDELRRWLRDAGISELAYAEYGEDDADELNSWVMIIDAHEGRGWDLFVKLRELEAKTYESIPLATRVWMSAMQGRVNMRAPGSANWTHEDEYRDALERIYSNRRPS